VSGAGRPAKAHTTFCAADEDFTAYGLLDHRHTPEMEQTLTRVARGPVTLSFTPLLVPMPRGILATCTARLVRGATTTDLRAALGAVYDGEPFVRLLPEGSWPTTKATAGSNGAVVQAAADTHAGRAVVTVAIDNLGKGAAGQAVQNANLMLDLSETAGLTAVGVTPLASPPRSGFGRLGSRRG